MIPNVIAPRAAKVDPRLAAVKCGAFEAHGFGAENSLMGGDASYSRTQARTRGTAGIALWDSMVAVSATIDPTYGVLFTVGNACGAPPLASPPIKLFSAPNPCASKAQHLTAAKRGSTFAARGAITIRIIGGLAV